MRHATQLGRAHTYNKKVESEWLAKYSCCSTSKARVGDGLGKTTGWIHRTGLHIHTAEGEPQVLPVRTCI
ncbi:hypothetical protein MAH4_30540 [Sessilibacter sp. MAH4]